MEVTEPLLVGEYVILQDTERYRFTSDSVLLARFVKAKRGERVADFCSGSGIVGLHFFAENEADTREVVLFEMDPALSAMSGKTVARNGLGDKFKAENVRLQDIPAKYVEYFSLILCNPPYEHARGGFEKRTNAVASRETELSLEELASAARRCLKFGGRFALIHRADRLSEVLCTLTAHGLEPKRLQLVSGKRGAKPYAALILAVKGGKTGLDVLAPAVNEK